MAGRIEGEGGQGSLRIRLVLQYLPYNEQTELEKKIKSYGTAAKACIILLD